MLCGYNTNGFPHHRLEDAVAILAEIGYRSVAVTLEHDLLDPPDRSGIPRCVDQLQRAFRPLPLRITIETGARFLLDPRRKHQPTLISPTMSERQRRIEFLQAAIDVAEAVGADSVSLWSGAAVDDADAATLLDRLRASLEPLLAYALARRVRLAFEPEPGMFIDTMAAYARLIESLHGEHPLLGLTLDVGHLVCLADGRLIDHVTRWRDRLWNVHIEDMRRGVHEHLMFGEGEVDFPAVFEALRQVGYAGPLHVELSRHGHDAVNVARRAFNFLQPFLADSAAD